MLLTMQQQDKLVSKKLATKKVNGNFVTYKYARRVMYDYLWDKHPELFECRGHTYRISTGELVLCPPKKSFNYLENGTWENVPFDTPVIAFRKYNGFMASARIVNDELLVATTGTTNEETSQYVGWARREILKLNDKQRPRDYNTTTYEIVIPEDPHIVDDHVIGAIPLLVRSPGPEGVYFFRGEAWDANLGEVLRAAKICKHEGWVVYNREEYARDDAIPSTCKIKTDYYVGKKKLMRMSPSKVDNLWGKQVGFYESLPDSWKNLAYNLTKYVDPTVWKIIPEQDRRGVIEIFEKEYYD